MPDVLGLSIGGISGYLVSQPSIQEEIDQDLSPKRSTTPSVFKPSEGTPELFLEALQEKKL